jgi:hypothetical protein
MNFRRPLRLSFIVSTKTRTGPYRSNVIGRPPKLLRYDDRHRRVESGLAEPVIVPNGLPRSADILAELRFLPALRTEQEDPFAKGYLFVSTTRQLGGVTKG